MKEYKDAHMKRFSYYKVWKNILEREFATFARGITHFPVLIKNILNVIWHAKNSSIQNIPSGKFKNKHKHKTNINNLLL